MPVGSADAAGRGCYGSDDETAVPAHEDNRTDVLAHRKMKPFRRSPQEIRLSFRPGWRRR